MRHCWHACRAGACTAISGVCSCNRALACEQDTFQVDFVVKDSKSGVFDNKSGQDYSLPLLGASTEQEILDRQAAVHEAAERERLAVSCLVLYESPLPCARPKPEERSLVGHKAYRIAEL